MADGLESELQVLRVDVTESGQRTRRGLLRCEIGRDVDLNPERLVSSCYAGWKPVAFDALLLAAAVEYCARTKKRAALRWGRRFELSLPMHEPDRWNAPQVVVALHEALNELTGDRWEITFRPRMSPVVPINQGRIDLPDASLVIMPYSDGMDSWAVAAVMSQTLRGKLIRVRLGSKQTDRPRRRAAKAALYHGSLQGARRPFSGDQLPLPRFQIAVVSCLAAYLSGAHRITVSESGQGALGPVVHAQPDFRNHPVFMRKIERFFAALLDHELRYDFPRLWFTKGKTLRASLDGGGDNSWRQTRSCWQRNRQMSVNKHLRQCGFCAACLLRRMSIHAVGLSEPADTYMYEDLAANTLREGVAPGFNKLGHVQHEYALAGILHLDHLASFQHSTGQGSGFRRSVLQLSAALNMPFTEVEANLRRLLSQHEAEWKSFVESLPPGSFIRSKSLQAA